MAEHVEAEGHNALRGSKPETKTERNRAILTLQPFDPSTGSGAEAQGPKLSDRIVPLAGFRTSSILKKWGRQEGAVLPLAEHAGPCRVRPICLPNKSLT